MKKNLFLCIVLLMSTFLYTKGSERYPRENNTYRIMSYNIRNGIGLDQVTDYNRTAQVIRSVNPDIIALQEVDSVTGRSKGIDVLQKLADYTGMYAIYSPSINFDGGKYGTGLLSKEKPLRWESIALPGREEARSLLIAEFEKYIVLSTHLSLNSEDRKTSFEIIKHEVQKYNKVAFLMGDLNAEPESDEIRMLSHDWKMLTNPKQATFPADDPREIIDYIFGYTAKGEIYSVYQARVVDEPVASDHRPLFVDVRLKTDVNQVMRTQPYLQNPSETGMTIMWITNVPCRSWVEYGTDTKNMKRARTFIEGEMVANNTINKIRLDDLKPATKYYYRVVSQEITLYRPYKKEFGDTVRSEISSFTTWDPNKKDVNVLVFNDIHKNFGLLDKLYEQVKGINYDLIIFNGDCIDDAQTEKDVVETIDYYGQKLGNNAIPSIYMRGNHETRGAYSVLLWDYLDRKDGKSYGAFTLGNARFVFLDNGEDKPDTHWVYYDMNDFEQHRMNQKFFLEKEVVSKDFKSAERHVLIHHIPLFGKNQDEYNPCKPLWESALAKGKFDISLNAHTHRYEYLAVGQDNNTYPVVIGGGNKVETGTVAILQKKGKQMNLRVVDALGKERLNLNL